MKTMKKILSLVMGLVMALAMSVTAFAADGTYHILIEKKDNEVAEQTYEAYQIFAGDLTVKDGNKVLSNITWGSGVDKDRINTEKVFQGKTAAEVAESLKNGDSDTAMAFAKQIAPYLKAENAVESTEGVEGPEYVIGGLNAGYYLVKNKDNSLTDSNDFYTAYIMQVVGDVTVKPKGDKPHVDKKIKEGDQLVDTNEASIGDKVSYVATSQVPDMSNYDKYFFIMNDTMSKGLTFNNDVNITIDGKTLNGDEDFEVVSTKNEDGTTSIKIVFKDFIHYKDQKGAKIEVSYSAILNEDAEIGTNPNTNKIDLVYSNNPNYDYKGENEPQPNEPTGKTPEIETETYTTELTVKKTDVKGQILRGAEFTLTGNGVNVVLVTESKFVENIDGTYWKLKDGTYTTTAPEAATEDKYESTTTKYVEQTVTTVKGDGQTETNVKGYVDPNTGEITFTGLGAGNYILTETVTPNGYNTIAPIEFNISFDAGTKKFASDNSAIELQGDNTLYTTVINKSGAELPSTGGIGTTIFYVVGGLLVVGAGIVLVTKKRMGKAE